MKFNASSPRAFTLLVVTAGLAACGSGGSSDSTPATTNSGPNPFISAAGTYLSGCVRQLASDSTQYTLVISNPVGSGNATANLNVKAYVGSPTCNAVNLTQDVTVSGLVTALPGTKTISPAQATQYGTTKSGIAKTATFRFDSVTLSLGSLTPIPVFGTSIKVGYLQDGNRLYALAGPAYPDGLGGFFDDVFLTKQ